MGITPDPFVGKIVVMEEQPGTEGSLLLRQNFADKLGSFGEVREGQFNVGVPHAGTTADAAADISVGTGTIDLNAASGIGSTAALELTGKSISADTTTGAINLNSLATATTGAVTVSSLTTGTGDVTFAQSGSQALTVTTASTTSGAISVSVAGGDLTATSITAGGASVSSRRTALTVGSSDMPVVNTSSGIGSAIAGVNTS